MSKKKTTKTNKLDKMIDKFCKERRKELNKLSEKELDKLADIGHKIATGELSKKILQKLIEPLTTVATHRMDIESGATTVNVCIISQTEYTSTVRVVGGTWNGKIISVMTNRLKPLRKQV